MPDSRRKKSKDKERRNSKSSLSGKMLLAHALVKFSGTPSNNLTKYLPFVLIVYFGAQPFADSIASLTAFAGKVTEISAKADVKIDKNSKSEDTESIHIASNLQSNPNIWMAGITISAILIAFGCCYSARRHRNLRMDTVQSMQSRIEYLETHFDSNRSTSGLTKRGETNPEDL